MGSKFSNFLDGLSTIVQIYLNSIASAEHVESQAKHSLISVLLLTAIGSAVLLSTWLALLVLIFFFLATYSLTYIQISAIIVGINLVLVIGVVVAFFKTATKVRELKNKSFLMLLNYFIVIIRETFQK